MAAYKTVELDDHLGGGPVQYREVHTKSLGIFSISSRAPDVVQSTRSDLTNIKRASLRTVHSKLSSTFVKRLS